MLASLFQAANKYRGPAAVISSGAGLSRLDTEGLGASERDVGVEGQRLARDQTQVRLTAGEPGHGDLGFQPAEVRAQAVLQALAERQVPVGVAAVQVERVWVGEGCASRPAAPSHRNSRAPVGRSCPARVIGRVVTRRQTGTDGSYRKGLLDRGRDQGRVCGDRGPAAGLLQQAADRVADQAGGGLVPGERPELGQFSAYLSTCGCGQARRGGRAGDLRR